MNIEFRFNSRSSGQNIPEAIRIAEKCGGFIEDKFYKIKFNDPQDDNLKKLYELVGNLKGSAVILDDKEPIVARKFFNAVSCPEKLLCKGTCKHVRFGYQDILEFLELNSESIEDNVYSTYRQNLLINLTDFLEEFEENRFRFNKKAFLNYFKQETEMETKFCDKYNFNDAQKAIERLPDEIKIIPFEESYEYLERHEEEEYDFGSMIREIMDHSEISVDLSMPEIIECSKTISFLTIASTFIPLENSDVFISSFPENKLILFTRL
ncbi:MAG: hypothetical protein ACFFDH_10680, partial [Promethearchaeota archaeon]